MHTCFKDKDCRTNQDTLIEVAEPEANISNHHQEDSQVHLLQAMQPHPSLHEGRNNQFFDSIDGNTDDDNQDEEQDEDTEEDEESAVGINLNQHDFELNRYRNSGNENNQAEDDSKLNLPAMRQHQSHRGQYRNLEQVFPGQSYIIYDNRTKTIHCNNNEDNVGEDDEGIDNDNNNNNELCSNANNEIFDNSNQGSVQRQTRQVFVFDANDESHHHHQDQQLFDNHNLNSNIAIDASHSYPIVNLNKSFHERSESVDSSINNFISTQANILHNQHPTTTYQTVELISADNIVALQPTTIFPDTTNNHNLYQQHNNYDSNNHNFACYQTNNPIELCSSQHLQAQVQYDHHEQQQYLNQQDNFRNTGEFFLLRSSSSSIDNDHPHQQQLLSCRNHEFVTGHHLQAYEIPYTVNSLIELNQGHDHIHGYLEYYHHYQQNPIDEQPSVTNTDSTSNSSINNTIPTSGSTSSSSSTICGDGNNDDNKNLNSDNHIHQSNKNSRPNVKTNKIVTKIEQSCNYQVVGLNSQTATNSSSSSHHSSDESSSSIHSTSIRDEKRAKEANITMPYNDIVNLSIDHFNERLAHYDFTESQLNLIKDIRRRGKNKVAAQSCRKRKMDQIHNLQVEVDELKVRRESLKYKLKKFKANLTNSQERYNKIQNFINSQMHTKVAIE